MPTPASGCRWLLLVFTLPSKNGSVRVDIWRKLKRCGALPLPTAGYLLPNTTDNLERFEWLSAEIRKHQGQASVAQVQSFDDLPEERVVHLFTRERNKDYEQLLRQLKARRTERQLSVLRRRLLEISAIDFFDSPLRHKVEGAIAALQAQQSGKGGKNMKGRRHSDRTWITRHRPGIDRCASAWLIQRFIDPKARFAFGNKPEDQPDAIPFDMYGESGF